MDGELLLRPPAGYGIARDPLPDTARRDQIFRQMLITAEEARLLGAMANKSQLGPFDSSGLRSKMCEHHAGSLAVAFEAFAAELYSQLAGGSVVAVGPPHYMPAGMSGRDMIRPLSSRADPELTRRFVASSATFVVRCPNADVKEAVEALFVDLPVGSGAEPCREIVLSAKSDGLLAVQVEGGRDSAPQPLGGAMTSIVTAVSRLALDADPDHLHLHSAGLSLDGRGVLISAASGTGKTTLTAALALRGWTYVTDETLAFGSGSGAASSFPKPLVIKPGGHDLLPELQDARVPVGTQDPLSWSWWHVPPSRLSAPIGASLAPSLVVILKQSPDGSLDKPPVATPLHPADAVVALMAQTMDPERFGPEAVILLAQLAARCLCVSLTVGPLDAATSILEQLIRSEVATEQVRELENPLAAGDQQWQPTEQTRSVMIGERAVVHDTAGGSIVALDEAGSAVWLAVHGDPPPWWHRDTMHTRDTRGFLRQLASLGLVSNVETTEQLGA